LQGAEGLGDGVEHVQVDAVVDGPRLAELVFHDWQRTQL